MLTIFSQNSKVSECNGELKGLSLFLYFIFSYMWAINQVFYKKKKYIIVVQENFNKGTSWTAGPGSSKLTTPKFNILLKFPTFISEIHQGPIVQSIISLTSLLRGQLVKCFMTL